MKRLALITLLLLTGLTCFSQSGSVFIGISGSFSHDDMRDNLTSSPGIFYSEAYHNIISGGADAGFFISDNSALLLHAGYSSDYSYTHAIYHLESLSFEQTFETKNEYLSLMPGYRYNKRLLGLLDLYCDLGLNLSLVKMYSNNNGVSTEGSGFQTGLSVSPGVQLNLSSSLGISLGYSLAGVSYTSIKEADSSEVTFDPVTTWDYSMDMSIAKLRLGLVFKF